MDQPTQNQPNQKENKNRLLSLRKLARTPYDKTIIQTAINDGMTDDDIKIMLGHPTGPTDPHELPENYDVDVQDDEADQLNDDQDAPKQVRQDEGPADTAIPRAPDSGKAILSHIAGLLTHLSKE